LQLYGRQRCKASSGKHSETQVADFIKLSEEQSSDNVRGFTMAHDFAVAIFGHNTNEALSVHMSKKTVSPATRKKLEQAAAKVMKNAHAPYSNFHVGAAILLTNGKVFSGCNVENASYGMSNCAERTAIFSAVAELGPKIEIQAVAVTNDQGVACSPCGACRQVIYEFGPDATIFFQGVNGLKQAHITELLPEGFRLQ
jgi:cytidine deaminase